MKVERRKRGRGDHAGKRLLQRYFTRETTSGTKLGGKRPSVVFNPAHIILSALQKTNKQTNYFANTLRNRQRRVECFCTLTSTNEVSAIRREERFQVNAANGK